MQEPFYKPKHKPLYIFFFSALCLLFVLSYILQPYRATWINVPAAPEKLPYTASFLGDEMLAYRTLSMFLQNIGGSGGRVTPIKDYQMPYVAQWLNLGEDLDQRSDFLPHMGAYFFGGSQNPEGLDPIIEYLAQTGKNPYARKWFWLWQAVYLSKFRQKDDEKALAFAYELADLYDSTLMPAWVAQAPALILSDIGEKEAAYAVMIEFLQQAGDDMDPAEVFFAQDYICNRLLSKEEARIDPLCAKEN